MKALSRQPEIKIGRLRASTYVVPTDFPESDGTLEWNATTLVLVEVPGAEQTSIGYTYANGATARLINDTLADVVEGRDVMATSAFGWRWSGQSGIWVARECHRWPSPRSTTRFGISKPASLVCR
jgi:hypothetical protein